jgi:hypothetical protein
MRGGGEGARALECMTGRANKQKWAGVKHVEKMIL